MDILTKEEIEDLYNQSIKFQKECTLCNWTDYEGDWCGKRWIKKTYTICPVCGKHFSGKINNSPTIHSFLKERLKRNNRWWDKFKDKIKYWIEVLGIAFSFGGL